MFHRAWSTLTTVQKIAPHLILLVAFWLQLSYLAELQAGFPAVFGQQPFCGVDAVAHVERAEGLLDGLLPGENSYFFIPLYPLFLASLKSFGGHSLLLPIYLQALLQLLAVAALYSMGRMLFSAGTGALAALGLASYNYYLFYLPCFDQVLLTVPFFTLGIFFVLSFHRSQKLSQLIWAGITLGLAAMSRPTILVVLPVIILWLFFYLHVPLSRFRWQRLWRFIQYSGLLVVPFLIMVSPITWHNYQVSGRFILISDNLGVNLFTGNNPDAYGLDSLAHVQSQPAVVRFIETQTLVNEGKTTLTAEVWRYISQQPGDWLALTAKKAWLWLAETDERLVSPYFPLPVSQSSVLSFLPIKWPALAVAALLGLLLMVTGQRNRRAVYLLGAVYGVFSAATIIFFIQLRFRLPFAPFVLLAAAVALTSAPKLRQQNRWLYWLVVLGFALLYPFIPGLWLFILLFVGLGLGAKPRPAPQISIFVVLIIISYLFGVSLWQQARAPAAAQTIDHYLGPPLVGEGVLGQTFQISCNGLNQIEITLGLFDHPHNQPVTFYLATDKAGQNILYSEKFEGSLVKDYQKWRFSFPPVADSAGQTYFFFLASPAATLNNTITARGYTDTPVDHYTGGSAYAGELGNLQKTQADFAFAAYCQPE